MKRARKTLVLTKTTALGFESLDTVYHTMLDWGPGTVVHFDAERGKYKVMFSDRYDFDIYLSASELSAMKPVKKGKKK